MADIGLGPSGILAIFLESILYGLFLLFFCILVLIVQGEKEGPVVQRRMLQVSGLMMILATVHIIIAFIRVLRGFQPQNGVINPSVLGKLEDPLYKAKVAIYFIQTMLGDAVMLWRCYVIYDKRWWILIPGAFTQLLDIAILVIRLLPPKNVPGTERGIPLIPLGLRLAFLGVTLALHLVCSAAIVTKIYLTRRNIKHSSRSLSPVIVAIIESALIYTVCVLLLLICNVIGSPGQFVVMDLIVPLVGVVFCMIVLRLRFYLRTPGQASDKNDSNRFSSWRPRITQRTVDEIQIQYTQEHVRTQDVSFPATTASYTRDREARSSDEIYSMDKIGVEAVQPFSGKAL